MIARSRHPGWVSCEAIGHPRTPMPAVRQPQQVIPTARARPRGPIWGALHPAISGGQADPTYNVAVPLNVDVPSPEPEHACDNAESGSLLSRVAVPAPVAKDPVTVAPV